MISRFSPTSPDNVRMICRLVAETGIAHRELANILGVPYATLQNWYHKHPKFKLAVKKARYAFDTGKVERSLLRKAMGYDYMEISKERIRLIGQLGKEKVKIPATKIKTTTKHVIPSDTAIIFWLTNRDPEAWKHIQKFLMDSRVQHDVDGKVDHAVTISDLRKVPKDELEQVRKILEAHTEEASNPKQLEPVNTN